MESATPILTYATPQRRVWRMSSLVWILPLATFVGFLLALMDGFDMESEPRLLIPLALIAVACVLVRAWKTPQTFVVEPSRRWHSRVLDATAVLAVCLIPPLIAVSLVGVQYHRHVASPRPCLWITAHLLDGIRLKHGPNNTYLHLPLASLLFVGLFFPAWRLDRRITRRRGRLA